MKKILILMLTLCVIASGALAESALYTADGDDQSALYLDGAQTLAMCGGTRKIPAISLRWYLRVSRNCASSGAMPTC